MPTRPSTAIPLAPQEHPGGDADAPHYKDQTLSGRILLDGARFERCRFKKALLLYQGGSPPSLEGCIFEEAVFEFGGAAGRTLAMLQAMSGRSSGLRDVFKASFPSLSDTRLRPELTPAGRGRGNGA